MTLDSSRHDHGPSVMIAIAMITVVILVVIFVAVFAGH
jgi:hypothetical protein